MFDWLKKLFHVEQTSTKEKVVSAFIFFLYIFLLGFGGSKMNAESQAFYDSLVKPDVTPPEWVFPIVWAVLFFLIGLAGYYAWNFYESNRHRKIFAFFYLINGILVYAWTCFFFTQQSIIYALYAIIGLIIVIELMILTAFKTNRKAAYLLIPYLLWVFFATYLNISFIVLNTT